MPTNHYKVIPPNKLDKYYISYQNGGISTFAPRDKRTGYTLPNCTAFAEGWFNKEYNHLKNEQDKIVYSFRGNACDFYKDAKRLGLETGKELKAGAMMCWSGGKGHVAICDRVLSDGTAEVCESNYSGVQDFKKFIASNSNGRWGMSSAYTFLGCIYNPAIKQVNLPVPVARSLMEQVEVVKPTLNVRTYPTLTGEVIGLATKGFYDVLETKEAEGFTWYRVGEWQWMAGVEGTLKHHPAYEIGRIVRVKAGAPVRISYRSFAYECDWIIEKEMSKRVLLKHSILNYHITIRKEYLLEP